MRGRTVFYGTTDDYVNGPGLAKGQACSSDSKTGHFAGECLLMKGGKGVAAMVATTALLYVGPPFSTYTHLSGLRRTTGSSASRRPQET